MDARDSRPSRTSEVVVRPAEPGHAASITSLVEHLGYRLSEDAVHERLTALSSSSDDVVAVAVTGSAGVVGFVSAHFVPMFAETDPGFVRITALSVAGEVAGQGVGRSLVDFVEEWARTRQASLIEVSSGRRAERAAAHRFYPAIGFSDAGASAVRYHKRLRDRPAG